MSNIELKRGDILKQDAEALVNAVNCLGVMGRGVALQFRRTFPQNYADYRKACHRGEVEIGRMFVHDLQSVSNPRFVINFPTKRHWKDASRIADIEIGLVDLARVLRERRIRSVAVPAIGCGLGALDWSEVRPRIEKVLAGMDDLNVFLYEPRMSESIAPQRSAGENETVTEKPNS